MNQGLKALYNGEYDRRMQYKDNTLSRKPGSTKAQKEALQACIAERKANGTLGKIPFVLEAVSKPYVGISGKWSVSLTYSDGITNRVPEVRLADKAEANEFYGEAVEHIGQRQEVAIRGVQS